MDKFKELTIRRMPNSILPQLPLNGKWLEDLGFTIGCGVRIIFEDSCLTLIVDNDNSDFLVESRMVRKKPRTILNINAFHLKRYGFNSGDRVGLTLSSNMIQISKINRFTILETS